MRTPLDIRMLGETIGAEILGFDFRRAAGRRSDDTIETQAWHTALEEFHLLVFRDAALDAEAQVAFVETLGPALIENEIGRAYQFVSNTHAEGILGDEAFAFHSDHAFMPDPIDFISLQALELPEAGTQTRFVDAAAAARALPEALRKKISGLRARHIIDPTARSADLALRRPRLSDELPHAYHPMLSTHPRTREPILYVSEQQTDLVESLPDDESRALIEALFAHLYDPRFGYQHEWRTGDLLIWDNRALQHAREAVPPGVSRTLRRVSVGGTSVYAYFKEHLARA